MAITASQVAELRKKTDCGMMDCKKALVECDGDMEKAIEHLRKKGIAKAEKRADKIAAEGVIAVQMSDDQQAAAMLEINCETDFVARDDSFQQFVEAVSKLALDKGIADLDALGAEVLADGKTVDDARQALTAKIGENINIRRIAYITTTGRLGSYVHGGRIGVLVAMEGADEALAKDIAMHIAASNPIVVDPLQVDSALLERERKISEAQAIESGKPENIIEKMVEGRLKKFVNEISLVGQPFVKDPNTTVGAYLKQHNAEVESFLRFAVGEGIEKKKEDFAKEVMDQLK